MSLDGLNVRRRRCCCCGGRATPRPASRFVSVVESGGYGVHGYWRTLVYWRRVRVCFVRVCDEVRQPDMLRAINWPTRRHDGCVLEETAGGHSCRQAGVYARTARGPRPPSAVRACAIGRERYERRAAALRLTPITPRGVMLGSTCASEPRRHIPVTRHPSKCARLSGAQLRSTVCIRTALS